MSAERRPSRRRGARARIARRPGRGALTALLLGLSSAGLSSIGFSSIGPAQELSWSGPEPAQVSVGQRALVTLRVEGALAELGLLPRVEGLALSVIDRKRETEPPAIVFTLGIEALRAGSFELPPLSVETATATLATGPLRLEARRDEEAERVAFVELSAAQTQIYVHQPVLVTLRFGVERAFLRDALLQPFRQELDLPVELRAGWLQELAGARVHTPLERDATGPRASFVLDGARAFARRAADRVVGERTYAVLELERLVEPLGPGVLRVPAPLLSFSFASRFETDFLRGRVALDRRAAHLAGEPLLLEVSPLPAAGRPQDFCGAVGRFAVEAQAEPRELVLGESLVYTLHITGSGNLADFDAPALRAFEDFDLLTQADERGADRRTLMYELAPRSVEVVELPAFELVYFDTDAPAGYRSARTRALSISVRPGPGGARYLPGAEPFVARPGIDVPYGLKSVSGARQHARRVPDGLLAGALLAPWLVALLLHRRARRPHRPGAARRAAAAVRVRAARDEEQLGGAYRDYLAAWLCCPAPGVIAPRLAARLEAEGVASELAARAATLLEELVAARYGGRAVERAAPRARACVQELERAAEVAR